MNTDNDKRIQGFLKNDDFVNYILSPTLSLKEMWDDFFQNYPDMIPVAYEASQILKGETLSVALLPQDALILKSRIFEICGLNTLN